MRIYTIVDPGGIRCGEIYVDPWELNRSHEIGGICRCLVVVQPSEPRTDRIRLSLQRNNMSCTYLNESVVKFCTGTESP